MPFARRPRFDWQLRTRSLPLGERTLVIGVLNVTPDSFSDGGRFVAPEAAVAQGLRMLDEGADVLDIGGESTRPGAGATAPEEELERVLPVVAAILAARPSAVLSIDTFHASTAEAAVAAGVEIVNDVSGLLWDPAVAATCARLGCGLVVMHTRGRPQEWRELPPLASEAVVPLVLSDLANRIGEATAAGVLQERIVIDPGFGFGKRLEENYPLLAELGRLAELGLPLLSGTSRKGFLASTLAPMFGGAAPPMDARLHATTASNVAAILAGAHIIRTHDVRPAVEAAAVADRILASVQVPPSPR
jgi:dihydropteroate synthase